jgi:hypothetical protein
MAKHFMSAAGIDGHRNPTQVPPCMSQRVNRKPYTGTAMHEPKGDMLQTVWISFWKMYLRMTLKFLPIG